MFEWLNASYVTTKVITTSSIIFLFLHWISCLYPLGITGGKNTPDTGSPEFVLTIWRRSIAIAVANVIGVNMGITAHTMNQLLTFIAVAAMGLIVIIYLTVQIAIITRIVNFSTTRFEEMQRQLKEYIKFKQIPPALERRLIDYSKFSYLKTCLREPLIFEFLSSRLRQEVLLHSCNRLIDQMPFFYGMPPPVIAKIVALLTPEVVLTNDVIIRGGLPGDSMYFISSGCVSVISLTGREICHLSDGAHFGEIALVEEIPGDVRHASVVAIEPTELYRLTRANFMRAVAPHPELLQRVVLTAKTREDIIRELEDPEVLEEMEAAATRFARAGGSTGRGRGATLRGSFYQHPSFDAKADSIDTNRLGRSERAGTILGLSLPKERKRLRPFVPKVPASMSIMAPKSGRPPPGEVHRSAAGPSIMEQSLLSNQHVQLLRQISREAITPPSSGSASNATSSGLSKLSDGENKGGPSKPRPRSK